MLALSSQESRLHCSWLISKSLNLKLFFFLQSISLIFKEREVKHKNLYIHHVSNQCKFCLLSSLIIKNAYLNGSNFCRDSCRYACIALFLLLLPWLLLRVDLVSGHMKNAPSFAKKLLLKTLSISLFFCIRMNTQGTHYFQNLVLENCDSFKKQVLYFGQSIKVCNSKCNSRNSGKDKF